MVPQSRQLSTKSDEYLTYIKKMKESGDTSLVRDTEDDLQWMTDIILAIEEERWVDAQILLLARIVLIEEASSRLFEERKSLLNDWRLRLHGLPERDYRQLVNGMEQTTFGYIKGTIMGSYLASLRKFLNTFKDILVKLAAAFLFAAPAAIAHNIVAAQIEHAFDGWLWQYFALVAFILAYRAFEKPLEGALEKWLTAVHKWGLLAEAQGAYVDAILVRQMLAKMSSMRASLASNLRKDQQ